MTRTELDAMDGLWTAARVTWEDCGNHVARPIIALLERQEFEQAAQMVDERFDEYSEVCDRYQREALANLAEEIKKAMETP